MSQVVLALDAEESRHKWGKMLKDWGAPLGALCLEPFPFFGAYCGGGRCQRFPSNNNICPQSQSTGNGNHVRWSLVAQFKGSQKDARTGGTPSIASFKVGFLVRETPVFKACCAQTKVCCSYTLVT